MYVCGRDNRFRPIIVVNAARIMNLELTSEQLQKLTIYVSEYVKEHIFVPQKVENWIFIIDLANIGIFKLPLNSLKDLGYTLEKNYRTKLYRLYTVNAPWTITVIYGFIKAFDKNIQKKIMISKTHSVPEMFNHINKSQIEIKYGGTMPDMNNCWPFKDDNDNVLTV